MLENLISSIYQKELATAPENKTTVDLIEKLQEEEILRMQERECKSYRDFREEDQDFAD